MYDFLMAADFMGSDPDRMKEQMCEGLGLPEQRDTARQDMPRHSYLAWHIRVHKSLAVAPTRLMAQGHREVEDPADPMFGAYLDHLTAVQGPARPQKSHAMVLVSRRLPELEEKLMRRKLPFRIAPIDEGLPFDRLWVGVTPENPRYEPSVDGGLFIEVIQPDPLQLPAATWNDPPPVPADPQPGDYVRVVARQYLVRDLDDVLRRLSLNLEWEPVGAVETVSDEGYRRARMQLGLPHGCAVELLEPSEYDCAAGRYLSTWGPGIFTTRLAVSGLDARVAWLRERGTDTNEVAGSGYDGTRVSVPAEATGGLRFELVEFSG